MDADYLFKIVIIGDSGVGKSSILNRFCSDFFDPNSMETIGMDLAVRTINVNNKKVKIHVWDTSGQEKFRALTENYYRDADGVLLVFDLAGPTSGYNVEQWIYKAEQKCRKDPPMMILGNKSDLVEKARRYSFSKPYRAVSAKTGKNIEEVFQTLCKEMMENVHAKLPMMLSPALSPVVVVSKDRPEKKHKCC